MFKFITNNLFGMGAFLGMIISPILILKAATKLFGLTDRSVTEFLISWVGVALFFMVSGIIKDFVNR